MHRRRVFPIRTPPSRSTPRFSISGTAGWRSSISLDSANSTKTSSPPTTRRVIIEWGRHLAAVEQRGSALSHTAAVKLEQKSHATVGPVQFDAQVAAELMTVSMRARYDAASKPRFLPDSEA
jgi:hypothetical protein